MNMRACTLSHIVLSAGLVVMASPGCTDGDTGGSGGGTTSTSTSDTTTSDTTTSDTTTSDTTTSDTTTSDTTTTTTSADPGQALQMSALDQSYVDIGGLAVPASFTIELWVQPDDLSDAILVSKEQSGVAENQFRLGIEAGALIFMMSDGTGGGGLWDGDYMLSSVIPAGQWSHVAVTKNGATFTLLVDGATAATFDAATDLTHTGTAAFRIGARVGADGSAPDGCFSGIVDELRIWSIARDESDIAADMGTVIPSDHPQWNDLAVYYRFDEGQGTTAGDEKGAYPGTLVNAPTWMTSTAPF